MRRSPDDTAPVEVVQGWMYGCDHQDDYVNFDLTRKPALGRGRQTWQMNEINTLTKSFGYRE